MSSALETRHHPIPKSRAVRRNEGRKVSGPIDNSPFISNLNLKRKKEMTVFFLSNLKPICSKKISDTSSAVGQIKMASDNDAHSLPGEVTPFLEDVTETFTKHTELPMDSESQLLKVLRFLINCYTQTDKLLTFFGLQVLLEVSKNVKSISARMDAVESNLRANSDSTRQNSIALDGISHALRSLLDSVDRHSATPEPAKDGEDGRDAAYIGGPAHTPRNAETTATNKDLLRRLKRGYLVQFDHDEPTEEQSNSARKIRFMDVFKREVRSM